MDETMFRDLMQAWLSHLGSINLGLNQASTGSGEEHGHVLSLSDGQSRHLKIQLSGQTATVLSAEGADREDALCIIADASSRTLSGDMGSMVVYETELRVDTVDVRNMMHFLRILTDQVHIEGARRLGDAVILDFPVGAIDLAADPPVLVAPQTTVTATIFAPGPTASTWTERVAGGFTEIAAALCAIATGRPVDFDPPVFPVVEEEKRAAAMSRQMDPSILTLARDGRSLYIFRDLATRADLDGTFRARGSALAYHAGLAQKSPDIAVMLFVTAIEALIAPRFEWGKARVTARFVDAVLTLCPDDVNEMIAHRGVQEAFDFRPRGGHRRQARELLERIYDARSRPTHAGLEISTSGVLAIGSAGSTRMDTVSQLARAVFFAYLQAPRSSLIGHPACDPAVAEKLTAVPICETEDAGQS